MQFSDLYNILFGKFGAAVILAPWPFFWSQSARVSRSAQVGISFGVFASTVFISCCAASLFTHICHVVGLCAQKQMVRIAAGAIVAFMANLQLQGVDPVMQVVSNAMRSPCRPMDYPLAVVISGIYYAPPLPTFVGMAALHKAPKVLSLLRRDCGQDTMRFSHIRSTFLLWLEPHGVFHHFGGSVIITRNNGGVLCKT